jgi:hypothetical protein
MKNVLPGTPADQAAKVLQKLESEDERSEEEIEKESLIHRDALRFLDFFISEYQARFKEKPKIKSRDLDELRDHMRDSEWSPVRYAWLLVLGWGQIGQTVTNKNGSKYSFVHCVQSQRFGYFATHIQGVISDTNANDIFNEPLVKLWPDLCGWSYLDEEQLKDFFRLEWNQIFRKHYEPDPAEDETSQEPETRPEEEVE